MNIWEEVLQNRHKCCPNHHYEELVEIKIVQDNKIVYWTGKRIKKGGSSVKQILGTNGLQEIYWGQQNDPIHRKHGINGRCTVQITILSNC